jgi:Tol biopolymer transport system component
VRDKLPPYDAPDPDSLLFPGEERHLRNVRQLTRGHSAGQEGVENTANYAEAYWSPDGTKLILQATRNQYPCDQEFVMDVATGEMQLVSTGKGRVTCGFYADEASYIYASTHQTMGESCPPPAEMSKGYVWPLYDYDIYMSMPFVPEVPLINITDSPGYDAEGTVDWINGWLYFTSTRDGDLDIYRMNLRELSTTSDAVWTGEAERLTDTIGYDGGPFVSYDGKTVVYRRQHVAPEEEAEYRQLLAEKLVKPSHMELWAMDADGGNQRQLTDLGGANFAPFLSPDNSTVIFCSNHKDPKGRTFELYTIPFGGGEVEQVTHGGEFDGFPMWSPDGKYLAWCSNRNGSRPRETNVFVAEWIP